MYLLLLVLIVSVGSVPSADSIRPGASASAVAGRRVSRYTPFLEAFARCFVIIPGTDTGTRARARARVGEEKSDV